MRSNRASKAGLEWSKRRKRSIEPSLSPPPPVPNGRWRVGTFPPAVGTRVAVHWARYNAYFYGTVDGTDCEHLWTTIAYDDGELTMHDLQPNSDNTWFVKVVGETMSPPGSHGPTQPLTVPSSSSVSQLQQNTSGANYADLRLPGRRRRQRQAASSTPLPSEVDMSRERSKRKRRPRRLSAPDDIVPEFEAAAQLERASVLGGVLYHSEAEHMVAPYSKEARALARALQAQERSSRPQSQSPLFLCAQGQEEELPRPPRKRQRDAEQAADERWNASNVQQQFEAAAITGKGLARRLVGGRYLYPTELDA